MLSDRILHWAQQIQGWNLEWITGIFPGEMAAFLGLCDEQNVQTIIESGRGRDAYSTQILGEYALKTNIQIVSMDFSKITDENFHARMEKYKSYIDFLSGDAFSVTPRAFKNKKGPFALLLDGPKQEPANRLSLTASALWDVAVVAHHNTPPNTAWGKEFSNFFPDAFYYESLGLDNRKEWRAFKEWEAKNVANGNWSGRSLGESSLVLARVPKEHHSKKRLKISSGGPIGYRPCWLSFKWSYLPFL